LLIAGAGGHGRVVADAALRSGQFSEIAFLDDGFPGLAVREGWPVLGRLDSLPRHCDGNTGFFPAFGDAVMRLAELDRARGLALECPTIVHPDASVSDHAQVGSGSVVCAGAVIAIGAVLGKGCIVNHGAMVDHDCRVGDGAHLCPGTCLAGNVTVGNRAWVGIGAVAKQGVNIGADSVVGAGAVVIADVPAGKTHVGVPAREVIRK
jgi:sugar O-acyltransferase (sialic acid O-acetyltransferase NeuD family)